MTYDNLSYETCVTYDSVCTTGRTGPNHRLKKKWTTKPNALDLQMFNSQCQATVGWAKGVCIFRCKYIIYRTLIRNYSKKKEIEGHAINGDESKLPLRRSRAASHPGPAAEQAMHES